MQVLQEPLGNLSAELRQRFAQIGAVWGRDINAHRDLVINAYTPLVAAAANDAADRCEVRRDVPYGPHERQRLDVFVHTAARLTGHADVVVFVHGGAFLRGSKSFNGLIYDNVSRRFARQGCVAMPVEARLCFHLREDEPAGSAVMTYFVTGATGFVGRAAKQDRAAASQMSLISPARSVP